MSWSDFEASLQFQSVNWPGHPANFTQMDPTTEAGIRDVLHDMYDLSPAFQAMVAVFSPSNPLGVGFWSMAGDLSPGAARDGVIGENLANINKLYFVDDHGAFVQDSLRLDLVHEIAHLLGYHDPVDAYGVGDDTYEYKGGPVGLQNLVAAQLGLPQQAAYWAYVVEGRPEFAQVTVGVSYTAGAAIDAAIIDAPADAAVLDLSAHTSTTKFLILAIDGDDSVVAGSGDDYVYGGDGNDTLTGGAGGDRLFGEAGNDKLNGGDGDDTLSGGLAAGLSTGSSDGADSLNGDAGNDRLETLGQDAGRIFGGDGNDLMIAHGAQSTLDGGAGDDLIDARRVDIGEDYANGVVVRFDQDSGHDYILGDFDANVFKLDMAGVTLSDVTIVWDRRFDHTEEVKDGDFTYATEDYFEGDMVLKIGDSATIYLGNLELVHYTDLYTAEEQDYWGFITLPQLAMDDFDEPLDMLFYLHPDHVTVGSVAAYLHAPDNWPGT